MKAIQFWWFSCGYIYFLAAARFTPLFHRTTIQLYSQKIEILFTDKTKGISQLSTQPNNYRKVLSQQSATSQQNV
jgi:hypothetical protein